MVSMSVVLRYGSVFLVEMARDFFLEPLEFLDKVERKTNSSLRFGQALKTVTSCLGEWIVPDRRLAQLEITRNYSMGLALLDGESRLGIRKRWARFRYKIQQAELRRTTVEPSGQETKFGTKRILHLLTNSVPYTQSGYTERTLHVLRAQSKAGFQLRAATRFAYPLSIGRLPTSRIERIGEVEVERIIPGKPILTSEMRERFYVDRIVEICKAHRIEAIHTTTGFPNAVIVSRAARELNIPWFYEVRGELELTWLSRFHKDDYELAKNSDYFTNARRLEYEAMSSCAGLVVLSDVSKRTLVDRGIDPSKIVIVPNALEDDFARQSEGVQTQGRAELLDGLGLDQNKIYVGAITSVVDYEGLDLAVDSLKFLPRNFELLIVGSGPDMESLKHHVAMSPERDRVTLVGRIPTSRIADWYRALDVFVMPRRDVEVCRRVTPTKALKAQALGVPVVASDLAPLREVTGGYARFFKPGDDRDLADQIMRALKGDIDSGAQDWLKQRTWSANAERYRQLYRKRQL